MEELICKQIGQMCRTCMRCNRENESDFQLYSIYNFVENYQSRRMQICELLNSAVPKLHKIEISDGLPTNICAICLHKLIAYDEFQNCCIDSELKIRNVLQIDHTNTNFKQNSTFPIQCTMETTTIVKQEIEKEEIIEIFKQQEIGENSNINPEGIVKIEPLLDIVNLDAIKKGDSQAENGILNDPLNTSMEQNVWRCESCSLSFLCKSLLTSHFNSQTCRGNGKKIGTKCFQCDFCIGAFTQKKNLIRHLLKIHNKDARTRLRRPNKLKSKLSNEIEDQSKSKPQMHDQSSTNEVRDSTKSAELNSNNIFESSLQNHNSALTTLKTEVTQILAENCNSDDTLTADKSRLENKTQNFKMWKCQNCLNLFYHRKNLARHMKSVHNENLPKDTQPVSGVENFNRLPTVYNCDKCERVFHKKSYLYLHQRDHLNPGASKTCQYCDKTYKTLDKLRDHERAHRNERPYLCSDCGKTFTSRVNFQQHRLRHSSERKYQCPQCPKKFSARSNLCSHIRQVHKQIKPFVCEVCGAAFKANHSLKKHTEIHTGNKHFKCDCCDKRFQRKETMERHRRTHTDEKPYKCKYCIRCYKAPSDLRKHLVTHLGEETFQCELCPATFRLARERQVHFASHRNDDDETKARNKQARLEALEELELKLAEKSTQ